jgi:hypothetical protein
VSTISSIEKRRQRPILLAMQNGECFWCGIKLNTTNSRRRDYATFDHLDERDSPNRGRFTNIPQVRRRVLACAHCNNDRAQRPLSERLMMADQAAWTLMRIAS